MNKTELTLILEQLRCGNLTVSQTLAKLESRSAGLLEYANVDCRRQARTGIPEVILGENKTAEQIIGIMENMMLHRTVVLATRVSKEKAAVVCRSLSGVSYHAEARMLRANEKHIPGNAGRGTVMVVSAGTSDIPVAEEAYLTLASLGHDVVKRYDIGVAGIHRLFSCLEELREATVIVVAAGMEGALPSVVAGLVSCPVVALPTSIGYGVGAGGIAALLGMLNSCAPGVAVVNIDNGFGAACMAAAINKKR